jgi:ferric-dicitrate binding protein FerR (iron transport regulator)
MTDFNFDRLGEHIASEQDALLAKHNAQAEVRSRIAELDAGALRKSARTAATRRAGMIWAGSGALTLAAAAVVLLALRGLPLDADSQTLSVQLADRHTNVEVGQYVQAPHTKQVGLQFSDGSHIDVAEQSRARLMGLRKNGADVSLESGLMRVQVKHRTDTSWHISAGPFGVQVIGTRFDVRWKPEDDSFELTLHEGKVELSGCAFSAGYRMLAGQTVRASCKNDRFDVSSAAALSDGAGPAAGSGSVESFEHTRVPEASTTPATPTTPVAAEPETAAAPAPATPAAHVVAKEPSKPAAPKPETRPDFRPLARAGQYAEALRTAKMAGFEQECARANARDLSLLAAVARYAQDTASESYALRLLRERFRGTKDASIAAFALGRIEFDNHGAYAKAAEWFRTYLREQPRGDLTREALGRLLEATQRVGDLLQTRELAARYLSEYPEGPHAGLAQRLREAGAL